MHRFGQRLRREILKPEVEDTLHGTTGHEEISLSDQELRKKLEEFDGQQIRDSMRKMGVEAVLDAIGASARSLRELAARGGTGEEVRERERVREGKNPYYLKRGEAKARAEKERFEALKGKDRAAAAVLHMI